MLGHGRGAAAKSARFPGQRSFSPVCTMDYISSYVSVMLSSGLSLHSLIFFFLLAS